MEQDFSWERSAREYDRMYREVCGVKEPSPDAEEVERFSQGQGADPSLRQGSTNLDGETGTTPVDGPTRSRNPLSLLRRRSEG
jgi:starch synthase